MPPDPGAEGGPGHGGGPGQAASPSAPSTPAAPPARGADAVPVGGRPGEPAEAVGRRSPSTSGSPEGAPRGAGAGPRGGGGHGQPRFAASGRRPATVRARKVRRIVHHIDPWSVLKTSLLFFLALFLIICVASAVLWSAARSSGAIDDVESFITSVGGFGNCEPIDGDDPDGSSDRAVTTTAPADQLDVTGQETTPVGPIEPVDPVDDEDCREGERLVGEFKFEDERIFQAFALGGIVLVLAGAAAAVVLAVLFNLISDLTGGVRVTVLEEDPQPRARASSPPPRERG